MSRQALVSGAGFPRQVGRSSTDPGRAGQPGGLDSTSDAASPAAVPSAHGVASAAIPFSSAGVHLSGHAAASPASGRVMHRGLSEPSRTGSVDASEAASLGSGLGMPHAGESRSCAGPIGSRVGITHMAHGSCQHPSVHLQGCTWGALPLWCLHTPGAFPTLRASLATWRTACRTRLAWRTRTRPARCPRAPRLRRSLRHRRPTGHGTRASQRGTRWGTSAQRRLQRSGAGRSEKHKHPAKAKASGRACMGKPRRSVINNRRRKG